MTKNEALKIAIEALSQDEGWFEPEKAIQACKEALEQPAQGPEYIYVNPVTQEQYAMTKIVNTHPAPSWQGLSDDEIDDISICEQISPDRLWHIYVAIEQALKEKNNV